MFSNQDALVAELRDQIAQRDTRYDALMEKYHALRVSGANATPAGLAPQARTMKPADEAIETVVARFPQWPGLRRQLQRFVLRERSLEGADEDKIAESVVNWRDPDDNEEVA